MPEEDNQNPTTQEQVASAARSAVSQVGDAIRVQAETAITQQVERVVGEGVNAESLATASEAVISGVVNASGKIAGKITEKTSGVAAAINGGPDDVNKIVEEIMSLVKGEKYTEAALYAGTQIAKALSQTSLGDKAKEYANKALEELGEFAKDPKQYAIIGLEAIGNKCRSSENKLVKAIGNFCTGLANFIEFPSEKIQFTAKMMKESLATICQAALGKAKAAHAR